MGLFGGIFKAIVKVAKSGLSTLTHGASDQVLKVLKGRGAVKAVFAKGPEAPATNNEQATFQKLLPHIRKATTDNLNRFASQRLTGQVSGIEGYKKTGKGGRTGKRKRKLVYEVADPSRFEAMQAYAASKGRSARMLTDSEASRMPPKASKRQKGYTKSGQPRKPPSPAQLAARERFIAMVRARKA